MEFRILGPIAVYEGETQISLGKPQERAVLAALLLHANEPLSRERLVDLLWGDAPPRTAPASLYNHVSRLRQALGADRLRRRGAAYEFVLGDGELDRDQFESLVRFGNAELDAGEAERATGAFREALGLWRGEALDDVRYESFAQAEIYRLEELRLITLERRIDAELELGLHVTLVAELESLAREHPLRERIRAQLMLALYRSGRQAEALDVFRKTRRLLVDELGLEPSPSLQQLEQAILRQDAGLAVPVGTESRRHPPTPPAASELPRGTVTLLFTDVEGSTRLLLELGDSFLGVLEQHRRVLRACFARHDGVEVDAQGDGFFVAFARASDALACATDAQQELAPLPARVRMGVHTGEPRVTDSGYVGIDVNAAARICAAGHGGQILVSEATARLVDAELLDLGPHQLKDLGAAVRIYQLGDGDFSPLRSLNRTNVLPRSAPLVGREPELAEITELLASGRRLVTLTGPGGVGKTRLALQAAHRLVEHFDGVWWVALAAVRDPALVLPAIEQAIGARSGIAAQIGDNRSLLVLDNFEQLLPAAPAVADLLGRCPNLQLCVTSRALLRIADECEYDVPVLGDEDAVALFRARAEVGETSAVAEICRRLDNLPLAIELAAARTRVLAPARLLERLEPRLPMLGGGTRDAPERHRTLYDAIEWSYDLLAPAEQRLFARLAVFAGSFTLEAGEEICSADLESVQSLVEQSLIRLSGERLVMLQTIREYAQQRLAEAGEAEQIARRHAEWILALCEPFSYDLGSTRLQLALPQLRSEIDNARTAVAWALEHAEPDFVLQLILASWTLGPTFGDASEWYDKALPRAGTKPSRILAHALRDAGAVAEARGESDKAADLLARSLAMYRELGDEDGETRVLRRLGDNALATQDLGGAAAMYRESLSLARRRADTRGTYMALAGLGRTAHERGKHDQAVEQLEQALALADGEDDLHASGSILQDLGDTALDMRALSRARARYRQGLTIAGRIWHDQLSTYCLAGLAAATALDGDAESAGQLWAAVNMLDAASGGWLVKRDRTRYETLVAMGTARQTPAFQRGLADAQALTHDQVLQLASNQESRSRT